MVQAMFVIVGLLMVLVVLVMGGAYLAVCLIAGHADRIDGPRGHRSSEP